MPKNKVSPINQKARLLEQIKELQGKVEGFDNQRANKVAALAKRYHLIDLDDETLDKELKAIRDKYRDNQTGQLSPMDEGKKNSTVKEIA